MGGRAFCFNIWLSAKPKRRETGKVKMNSYRPEERRCRICGQKKPLSLFEAGAWNPKNKNADVWVRACLSCKELNKHVAIPVGLSVEKLREKSNNIERTYGITLKEYEQLYVRQNGVCAICFHPEPVKNRLFLAVDHDHKTGRVRGLLCSKCNVAIGMFEDRVEVLRSAIRYLKDHKPLG